MDNPIPTQTGGGVQQHAVDSMDLPDASSTQVDEFDPGKLRGSILHSFSKLVSRACERMAQSQEQSVFRDPDDSRMALALVRLAPALMELLAQEHAEKARQELAARTCPKCYVCGAPAGKHWAHQCPQIDRADARDAVFDCANQSVYFRKDMGQPAPRREVPSSQNLHEWLERTRLTQQQYEASVDLRPLKRDAERTLHTANCAVADAARGKPISVTVAASCAKSVAERTLELLRRCNHHFNPFLPDPHPLDPVSKENTNESAANAPGVDDPNDPK